MAIGRPKTKMPAFFVYKKEDDCLYACKDTDEVHGLLHTLLRTDVPMELLVIEPKSVNVITAGFRPAKKLSEIEKCLTEHPYSDEDDKEE